MLRSHFDKIGCNAPIQIIQSHGVDKLVPEGRSPSVTVINPKHVTGHSRSDPMRARAVPNVLAVKNALRQKTDNLFRAGLRVRRAER